MFCVESADCAGIEPLFRRFWSTVERILLRDLDTGMKIAVTGDIGFQQRSHFVLVDPS
jgi:hypothetical protein